MNIHSAMINRTGAGGARKYFHFFVASRQVSVIVFPMNKTNINLHGALTKCRIMRRQGQISNVQQRRILRALCNKQGIELPGDEMRKRWERLYAMRALIDMEVAPKLNAHRKAQWETLTIGHKQYTQLATCLPKTKVSQVIPPIDPRFDHVWWKEQERLESKQKRIDREAAYA